jgi:hypothetical protein
VRWEKRAIDKNTPRGAWVHLGGVEKLVMRRCGKMDGAGTKVISDQKGKEEEV